MNNENIFEPESVFDPDFDLTVDQAAQDLGVSPPLLRSFLEKNTYAHLSRHTHRDTKTGVRECRAIRRSVIPELQEIIAKNSDRRAGRKKKSASIPDVNDTGTYQSDFKSSNAPWQNFSSADGADIEHETVISLLNARIDDLLTALRHERVQSAHLIDALLKALNRQ